MHIPLIIAHRGASANAPENTLATFRLVREQGADAIEADFHLTKDGRIICIHDRTTQRVAGVNLIVGEATLAQLRELDVGSWQGSQWAGERIPTIEEVLGSAPKGKRVFIEIKCGPEIIPLLGLALRGSDLTSDQVAVISFSQSVIAESKRQLADVKAFWLTSLRGDERTGQPYPPFSQILRTLKGINADGLDRDARSTIDAAFVAELRKEGMELHVWTVDDLETALASELLAWTPSR